MISKKEYEYLNCLAEKYKVDNNLINRRDWSRHKNGGGYIHKSSLMNSTNYINKDCLIIDSISNLNCGTVTIQNSYLNNCRIEDNSQYTIINSTLEDIHFRQLPSEWKRMDEKNKYIDSSVLNNVLFIKTNVTIRNSKIGITSYDSIIFDINKFGKIITPPLKLEYVRCDKLHISYGLYYRMVPQVSGFSLTYGINLVGTNHIAIGCKIHTILTWKKNYKKIAAPYNIYSDKMELYKINFNHLVKLLKYYMKKGWIKEL